MSSSLQQRKKNKNKRKEGEERKIEKLKVYNLKNDVGLCVMWALKIDTNVVNHDSI